MTEQAPPGLGQVVQPLCGIGHNKGPSMERGHTYRTFLWKKARNDLIPKLPIEIIKMRVNRARELGLDYKTYASVRASSGRDVIGFLFSSNALRLAKQAQMPEDRTEKLAALKHAQTPALIHAPLDPATALAANPILTNAAPAPLFTDSWSHMRDKIAAYVQSQKLPPASLIIVGDTTLERDWTTPARASAYLTAAQYFGDHP
jgi:hypothetical protein